MQVEQCQKMAEVSGKVTIHGAEVPVRAEVNITEEQFQKALVTPAFTAWVEKINAPGNESFVVKGITIQSIDMFGPRVG